MAELTVELDTSHSQSHFFLHVFLPRRVVLTLTCTVSSANRYLSCLLRALGHGAWGSVSIVFMVFQELTW